jgi:hypothetical protein
LTIETPDQRFALRNHPVDILTDSLTALTMANPPNVKTPAHLPEPWLDLAYDAWAIAQESIAQTWNASVDGSTSLPVVPTVIKQAIGHILEHSHCVNTDDADRAVKILRRGQASRVTAVIRAVMRDDQMTPDLRTMRLIEVIDELGLSTPERRETRQPISPDDIHLVAWTAIIPPSRA